MIRNLIALILNSHTGHLAQSTWKSILGVAIGVCLLLFITSKLDSFIVNMEDYMLNIIPEVQFQRTKNAFPTSLEYEDKYKLESLISNDLEVLVSGTAYFEIGIVQLKSNGAHINKRSLLFTGLIPENRHNGKNELLLNIKNYLTLSKPIEQILDNESKMIIISTRLEKKLFEKGTAIGKKVKIGSRLAKKDKLTEVTIAGTYNNDSVNAIFLTDKIASKVAQKETGSIANSYIVRLKDKYQAKDWRQALYEKRKKAMHIATSQLETLNENSQKYQYWKNQYDKNKSELDYIYPFLVNSWMDISPENLNHLKMTRIVMMVIFSAVLIMTALSIKFLFDTIVIEKRRQISTLKAIGFSNYTILWSFLIAGLIIGIVGVGLGVIIGYTLNFLTAILEVDYFERVFNFQYRSINPSISFVLSVSGLTIILCMISTLLPARNVMKILPIEGIKRDG